MWIPYGDNDAPPWRSIIDAMIWLTNGGIAGLMIASTARWCAYRGPARSARKTLSAHAATRLRAGNSQQCDCIECRRAYAMLDHYDIFHNRRGL